jgi:hypothetical protein
LNSGVNFRRFAIVFPPSDRFYVNYRTCPVFGGQYSLLVRNLNPARGARACSIPLTVEYCQAQLR